MYHGGDTLAVVERYRVLSHTADTAIEAEATSLDQLIENLAYGMFDLMFDLEAVEPTGSIEIEASAMQPEELIVDVLADLLFHAEAEDLVLSNIEVTGAGTATVVVTARGAPTKEIELRGPPIKAVTYHDLVAEPTGKGWYGRVIFDV